MVVGGCNNEDSLKRIFLALHFNLICLAYCWLTIYVLQHYLSTGQSTALCTYILYGFHFPFAFSYLFAYGNMDLCSECVIENVRQILYLRRFYDRQQVPSLFYYFLLWGTSVRFPSNRPKYPSQWVARPPLGPAS